MPTLPTPKTVSGQAAKSSPNGRASSPSDSTSPATGGTGKPGPPADPAQTSDQAKTAGDPATLKKSTKPLTIDPKLLERALLNRNSGR
jgi:hypothetical protein